MRYTKFFILLAVMPSLMPLGGCKENTPVINCGSATMVAMEYPDVCDSLWFRPRTLFNIDGDNSVIKAGDNYRQIGANSPDSTVITGSIYNTQVKLLIENNTSDGQPDIIKFNFDGSESFANCPQAKIIRRDENIFTTEQIEAKGRLDGRDMVMSVICTYIQAMPERKIPEQAILQFFFAAELKQKIDGQEYLIRIYDNRSNMKFNDRIPSSSKIDKYFQANQDFIRIYEIDAVGSIAAEPVVECFYGTDFKIGSKYYRLKSNADASEISLIELQQAVATVSLDIPDAQAILTRTGSGKNYLVYARDTVESVAIPGTYSIHSYIAQKDETILFSYDNSSSEKYVIKASTTNRIPSIFPLIQRIEVKQDDDKKYLLSLRLHDAQGRECLAINTPDYDALPAGFEIVDAKGESVHSGKFEYG